MKLYDQFHGHGRGHEDLSDGHDRDCENGSFYQYSSVQSDLFRGYFLTFLQFIRQIQDAQVDPKTRLTHFIIVSL